MLGGFSNCSMLTSRRAVFSAALAAQPARPDQQAVVASRDVHPGEILYWPLRSSEDTNERRRRASATGQALSLDIHNRGSDD
jgi:hypothetical protein